MSLIVHLMKKDAWYLRYEVAIWLLLWVGQSLLLLSGLDSRSLEPDLRELLRGLDLLFAAGFVLSAVKAVIAVVIAAQLVQSDALTGTTAFWRTRPIKRATLLASKLTFAVVVLLVVPFVTDILTFKALGMGLTESLSAAASGVLLQSMLVFPAMALASVTSGLAPCVVAGLLVVVGSVVARRSMVWMAPMQFVLAGAEHAPTLAPSRMLVFYAAAAASGIAVTVHQYLSLKTLRSMVLVPLAVVASLAVMGLWQIDLLERRDPPMNPALLDVEQVTLSLDPGSVTAPRITFWRSGEPVNYRRLYGDVSAKGAPAAFVVEPVSVAGELALADEAPARSTLRAQVQRFRGLTSQYPQLEHAMLTSLSGITWSNLTSTEGWELATGLADVPEEVYRRHEGAAGRYSAVVTLRAIRPEQVATMPLRPGAGFRRPTRRVAIVAVEPDAPDIFSRGARVLRVTLSETMLMPSWEERGSSRRGRYILVNRSTQEALFPDREGTLEAYRPGAFLGGDGIFLSVERRSLVFRTTVGDPQHPIDSAWLAQAELVRVEPVSLGVFTKPLKVDEFVLKPLR